jgi:hypothetical protein
VQQAAATAAARHKVPVGVLQHADPATIGVLTRIPVSMAKDAGLEPTAFLEAPAAALTATASEAAVQAARDAAAAGATQTADVTGCCEEAVIMEAAAGSDDGVMTSPASPDEAAYYFSPRSPVAVRAS